jgi:hypothetical protein
VPESLTIWTNGMMQQRPGDFNSSGARTIIFAVSPETGDHIVVTYLRS